MFLYLVPKGNLGDMRAAGELLLEFFGAKLAGLGYGSGLVYATDRPVPDDVQEVLGIIVWA